MWLMLVAAVLICDPPSQELRLRVVDANGAVVSGAEARKWSGRGSREALLGVTDASGTLIACVTPDMGPLGIYLPGFRPKKLTARQGQILVRLESVDRIVSAATVQKGPCVSGSNRDGTDRICDEDLKRLPLRY